MLLEEMLAQLYIALRSQPDEEGSSMLKNSQLHNWYQELQDMSTPNRKLHMEG
jgi:hypothetical protein